MPPFEAGSRPRLTATITPPGDSIDIVGVELIVNRDRDPARFDPTGAPAVAVTPTAQLGEVTATLPAGFTISPAQLLTVQWVVDYKLRAGTEVASAVSNVISRRSECTPEEVDAFLAGLQAAARDPSSRLPQTLGPEGLIALSQLGYVPSHFFVSFAGMGVAFANVSVLTPETLVEIATSIGLPQFIPIRPHLLLYAPSPAATAAEVAEPLVPDFPYTLMGIAFAAPYDVAGPPAFGCMPREAWFVHDAGWHLANGLFSRQIIPGEAVLGDSDPQAAPVILNPLDPRFGVPWHGRLWDVHLWFRPGGVPVVAACNPGPDRPPVADFFATTSIATCDSRLPRVPALGAEFPPLSFFARALPR